jgi:hypothetical protein
LIAAVAERVGEVGECGEFFDYLVSHGPPPPPRGQQSVLRAGSDRGLPYADERYEGTAWPSITLIPPFVIELNRAVPSRCPTGRRPAWNWWTL